MEEQLDLPSCVRVGVDSENEHKEGLFAKEPIERGTRLFSRKVYTFGVGSFHKDDLSLVCHHCERKTYISPVLCQQCKIIGYCDYDCLDAAKQLHALECKGVQKLEELRGKVTIEISRPSSWYIGYEHLWPPPHVMLAARIINMGIVSKMNQHDTIPHGDWIQSVCTPDTLPPVKAEVFKQLEKYVRYLVPDSVSDEEIRRAFLAMSVNTSNMARCPPQISGVVAYKKEYLMLNHVCKPNCEIDEDDDGTVAIYTIEDVAEGEQLRISFLSRDYYMNVRELRRSKLMECFGLDCQCYICKGEMVPQSRLWFLEQQKSSLITPWSPSTARCTMVVGWGLLCECNRPLESKSCWEVIQVLEPALEVQRRILDKRNAMLVIMATTLILKYSEFGNRQKVVDVFYNVLGPVGMSAMMEYGTRMDVAHILGNVCISLADLERWEEFREMFSFTRSIHPRQPSVEMMSKMLHLDDQDDDDSDEEDEILRQLQVDARDSINANYYAAMAELYEAMDPDERAVSALMQACQCACSCMHNGHHSD